MKEPIHPMLAAAPFETSVGRVSPRAGSSAPGRSNGGSSVASPHRKRASASRRERGGGFTLVEMLVVIGIIGILAAMVVALGPMAVVSRNKARIRAEMGKLQTVIEAYKARKGYYPPDNPANPMMNPLYYELSGTLTTNNGTLFTPVNGGLPIDSATTTALFNRGGIVNSTTDPQENPVFTHGFDPAQYGGYVTNGVTVNLLVCPIKPGPDMLTNPDGTTLNPWHYVSSSPPNNTESYDLWVDVIFRGKTNRFCNWSAEPIAF